MDRTTTKAVSDVAYKTIIIPGPCQDPRGLATPPARPFSGPGVGPVAGLPRGRTRLPLTDPSFRKGLGTARPSWRLWRSARARLFWTPVAESEQALAVVEIEKRKTPFGPPPERRYSPQELRQSLSLVPDGRSGPVRTPIRGSLSTGPRRSGSGDRRSCSRLGRPLAGGALLIPGLPLGISPCAPPGE